MEDLEINRITKGILSKSKLELQNPDFDQLLMNKIKSVSIRKKLFNNTLSHILMFLFIDACLLIAFKFFNISIISSSSEASSFANQILTNISTLINLIFENTIVMYTIIAITVLLLYNMIGSKGYRSTY